MFPLYDNYIFDLYGTLIDIRTDESKEILWKRLAWMYGFHGVSYSEKEIRSRYLELCAEETEKLKARTSYKHPEIELKTVFYKLFEEKGVKASEELVLEVARFFRVESTKLLRLYKGVKELLQALKADGKKLFVLSNAQRIFTWYELVALELVDYFDAIYISSDCECCKPEVAFFEKLISEQHLDKKRTIMIGNDCVSDIGGANNAGIDSLYINTKISPPENTTFNPTYIATPSDFSSIKKILTGKVLSRNCKK